MMNSISDEKSPLLGSIKSDKNPRTYMSTRQKFRNFLSNITVEPALFFHGFSYSIASIFNTNMMIDKVCTMELNYTKEVCDQLDSGNYVTQQDAVQKITSNYDLYSNWIIDGLSLFTMIFLGAWSDTKGRKLPLLFPLIGDTFRAALLLANAYFWYLKPYFIILCGIPYGLAGGYLTIFMAACAYLGDNSENRTRTTRLSLATVMMYLASPAGHAIGAILYRYKGYTFVFGLQTIVSCLSIIYVMLRFKSEPPPNLVDKDGEKLTESKKFNLASIKTSITATFKPREGKQRAYIILHITCIWITMSTYCSMNFLYLYMRKKFKWNYVEYTVWSTSNTPVSIASACIIMPILSYRLQFEDSMLGFIGAASHMFFGLIIGTAPYSWFLFLALVVSALSSLTITSSRGALSKVVAPNELGSIFATVGIGEAILPIIFDPIFTIIYNDTLEVFPGTVFVIGSGISVITLCIYTWLLTHGRIDTSHPQTLN